MEQNILQYRDENESYINSGRGYLLERLLILVRLIYKGTNQEGLGSGVIRKESH